MSRRTVNRYRLKPADIPKLRILNRDALTRAPFWYNEVIHAWCITLTLDTRGSMYGEDLAFWLGIYDKDAPAYRNKIQYRFTADGGMIAVAFTEFYGKETEDNPVLIQFQSEVLHLLNTLIGKGVLGLPS